MSTQTKGRPPTADEKARIKTYLCMPKGEPFIRCKARDRRKVEAFEAQDDFTHSEPKHVCEECRCNHIAGLNTSDDFYDIDGVGHYGVGFCYDHEKGRYRAGALDFARRQMITLQQHGRLMAENENYMGRTSEDLAVERCAGRPIADATRVEQVRTARNTVAHYLHKMTMLLETEGALYPDAVVELLEQILETVTDMQAAGLVLNGDDVISKLNDIFTHDLFATEKCGQAIIPMTYSTKIDKLKDLAVAASKIGLDDFRMTEKDYVEKKIVAMKLKQSFAGIGKELAPEFGDEVADRVKQNLVDRVFLPIWGDL